MEFFVAVLVDNFIKVKGAWSVSLLRKSYGTDLNIIWYTDSIETERTKATF